MIQNFYLKVLITSTTYITPNNKNTHMSVSISFFIIKEFIEVQTANCSLWSNGAMYFELKFISNDTGKWLYSFNHLLHSDLSTIYFPSSLNKLKLFLSPSSDCSNTNHATTGFLQQDNLPLGLTDVIFLLVYVQVMSHVAFPCLPSQMAE